jgi:hypothetical protein
MIPTSRSVDEEPSKERVQIVINRLGKEELPAINGQILEEAKDE